MLAVSFSLVLWVFVVSLSFAALRALREATVHEPAPGVGTASLSVIISARNEATRVTALLASVRAQDHPDFEVIFVDDRSTDGTLEIARTAIEADPRIRLLRVDQLAPGWQGRLYALSIAVGEARGDWLLSLSADQRIAEPTFFRAILAEYERRGVVAGAVLGPFEGTRWWQLILFRPIADNPVFVGCYYLAQRWRRDTAWLIGALAMKRQAYASVGGAAAAALYGAGGVFDDWGWTRAFELARLRTAMVYHPALKDVSNWESFGDAWAGLMRWCLGALIHRRGAWPLVVFLIGLVVLLNGVTIRLVGDLLSLRLPSPAAIVLSLVGPTIGLFHTRAHGYRAITAALSAPIALFIMALVPAAVWARLRNRLRWRGEDLQAVIIKKHEADRPATDSTTAK